MKSVVAAVVLAASTVVAAPDGGSGIHVVHRTRVEALRDQLALRISLIQADAPDFKLVSLYVDSSQTMAVATFKNGSHESASAFAFVDGDWVLASTSMAKK